MKQKKATIFLVLVLCMVLMCTGCGQKAPTIEESPAMTTAAPVEAAPEEEHVHTEAAEAAPETESAPQAADSIVIAMPEGEPAPAELDDDDRALLEALGGDIQAVDDASFPETVTELMAHVGQFDGQVFQLSGLYTTELDDAGIPFVYRALNHDGVITVAALPLLYLPQNLVEGDWITVTAIVGSETINGALSTVLEVVAVESTQPGAAELEWSGSAHAH